MQKNILIHVGPPKTGTSAIQFWLHQNIRFLSENNIFYPLHHMSQNGVSSGNVREIYDFLPDKSMRLNHEKVGNLLHEFEQGAYTTLLLSSEFFSNKLEELKTCFASAKFIFYIRNPVEIRESNYNQSVKRHGKFESLRLPNNGHIPHLEKLIDFNNTFGHQDIILRFYGQPFFSGGNIINDFMSICGLTVLTESEFINKSYQFEALEFKRWINYYDIQRFQSVIDTALQNFNIGCSDYSLFNQVEYLEQCEVFIEIMKPRLDALGVIDPDPFFNSMRQKSLYSHKEQTLSEEQFLLVTDFLQKKLGRTYNKLMGSILNQVHDENCQFIHLIKSTMTTRHRSYVRMGLSKVALHKLWHNILKPRTWLNLNQTKLSKLQPLFIKARRYRNKPIKIKLVAVARNEAAYLSEWIFHHLYFGFDEINIYINGTTDNSSEIINNLNNMDKVYFHDGDEYYQRDIRSPQNKIYSDELALSFKQGFSHVMFLDIDEFWVPKNLKDSIRTYAENNCSDVSSFEWLNRINESEIFAAPMTDTLQGRKTSQIKSLIKTGLDIQAVDPYSVLADKANYQLADGTVFKPIRGNIKAPSTELNKPVKEYFILHRMYRSDIEYVAMLGTPTAENIESNSRVFKENRHGYCTLESSVSVELPAEALKVYEMAYAQFVKRYSLQETIERARKLIEEKYHRTASLIREAPLCEAQLLNRLLTNVTLKPIMIAYAEFKKRHEITE